MRDSNVSKALYFVVDGWLTARTLPLYVSNVKGVTEMFWTVYKVTKRVMKRMLNNRRGEPPCDL